MVTNKQQQWNILYFIGAFALVMMFESLFTTWRTVETIPYSQFLTLLSEKKIETVTVHQEQITGRLKEPINGRQLFATNRVEPALAEQITKSGATVTGTVENSFHTPFLGHARRGLRRDLVLRFPSHR
jgi:cell division protease FtsH